MGADDEARMSLFTLASMGEPGKIAAADVIAKIVKFKTDGTVVNNWSALIHTTALDKRHQVTWWLHQPIAPWTMAPPSVGSELR